MIGVLPCDGLVICPDCHFCRKILPNKGTIDTHITRFRFYFCAHHYKTVKRSCSFIEHAFLFGTSAGPLIFRSTHSVLFICRVCSYSFIFHSKPFILYPGNKITAHKNDVYSFFCLWVLHIAARGQCLSSKSHHDGKIRGFASGKEISTKSYIKMNACQLKNVHI